MTNKCVRAAVPIVLSLLMIVTAFGGTIVGKENASKAATAPGNTGNVQKSPPGASAADYVIGAEDLLDINVWKEPEVSRTVPVRPDGKISLPLLNDVQAAGLTPMQLGSVITEQLKKFIAQPQVTVMVTTINSRRVYVLGEVNRGGAIPLMPNMTVLQALSSAGGFTQFANQKQIHVLRSEDGKQIRFPFNYRQAIQGKDGSQNIILKPGDTIVVP
jgi:polysaccharide export outer membrane protein